MNLVPRSVIFFSKSMCTLSNGNLVYSLSPSSHIFDLQLTPHDPAIPPLYFPSVYKEVQSDIEVVKSEHTK